MNDHQSTVSPGRLGPLDSSLQHTGTSGLLSPRDWDLWTPLSNTPLYKNTKKDNMLCGTYLRVKMKLKFSVIRSTDFEIQRVLQF